MFASVLGTFIAAFAVLFVAFLIIAGIFAAAFSDLDRSQRVTSVKDNSVLYVKLDRPIVDRGPEQQFNLDFGPFRSVTPIGLDDILDNLDKAAHDDRIEGIYLEASFPMTGFASLEEIRNALLKFKESGKWIVSYGEIFSQSGYYLSSVADEMYMYPEGGMEFKGLSTNIAFLKGMFEKLDVDMQVIRGSNNQFKSAVEPFMLEEMSQANRLQTETWMGSLWRNMLKNISSSTDITQDRLEEIANNFELRKAQDAVDLQMITALKYEDEVRDVLRNKVGIEDKEKVEMVSLSRYFRASDKRKSDSPRKSTTRKDKVALIFASGDIRSGKSSDDGIGSETLAKAIREARKDSTVKAVVLRVNSPGGSALASDVIWRETALTKEVKPLVVSMGDVAASGGYYIAGAADRIVAMPGTITGSIGVFGLLPNMKGFFNKKMGITFDGVKTARYADFGDVTRALSSEEYAIIQEGVDEIYGRFLEVVSEGRQMSTEKVDSIGQGRVWSGMDALELGLVDELGGMERAIELAAELAEIEDYKLEKLPKRKDPFQAFLEELTGEGGDALLRWQLGEDALLLKQFKQAQRMRDMRGIQAILPYHIEIE